MLNAWPALSLYIIAMLLIVEARALAGRATVGIGSLLLSFSFGGAGAGIANLLLQRIAIGLMDQATVVWSVGPLFEELLKAAPVVLVAYFSSERRRMTIADYALIGFASGAGFAFVESNLASVVSGTVDIGPYWWLPTTSEFGIKGSTYLAAGHPIWTGFIGLGVGIGVRLWPHSRRRFAPAAAAAGLVLFEHMGTNWKGSHIETLFGVIQAVAQAPRPVEWLLTADFNGRLVSVLFLPLLVIAAIAEGMWCRRAADIPRHLMLPDEGLQPLVLMEWIALARAARRGRQEVIRTAHYLRRRRELLLAIAELRREPASEELRRSVQHLRDRIGHERDQLTLPLPNRWLPSPEMFKSVVLLALRSSWPMLLSLLLVVLRFAFAPSAPGVSLLGKTFAVIPIAMAAGFLLWRYRIFQRVSAPRLVASDGERLVGYHTRALLLVSSAVSLVFSIAALFLSVKTMAPGASTFITGAFDSWVSSGGDPSSLGAVASMALASLADVTPADPCAPLQAEAGAADSRIGALKGLRGVIGGAA